MANRTVINHEAIGDMLRSSGMKKTIQKHCDRVAERAGPGYEPSTVVGKNRVHGSVITATNEAIRDNSRNNTLLKALG